MSVPLTYIAYKNTLPFFRNKLVIEMREYYGIYEICGYYCCNLKNFKFLYNIVFNHSFIHLFSSLSYDRSKASSKASSPHSAIQSFILQMRVSSSFLKVILPSFLRLLSCLPVTSIPFYLSFNNPL
jgi:hypothetical protein